MKKAASTAVSQFNHQMSEPRHVAISPLSLPEMKHRHIITAAA